VIFQCFIVLNVTCIYLRSAGVCMKLKLVKLLLLWVLKATLNKLFVNL